MYDWFRYTSRSAGVQDINRMIWREICKLKRPVRITLGKEGSIWFDCGAGVLFNAREVKFVTLDGFENDQILYRWQF